MLTFFWLFYDGGDANTMSSFITIDRIDAKGYATAISLKAIAIKRKARDPTPT